MNKTSVNHPIKPYMPAIFVPVRDLKQATEWYASLLDRHITPQEDQFEHGIYIFEFEGGMQLILERNNGDKIKPVIMFDADDIHAASAFCDSHPHESRTDVFIDEFVSVFNVNDDTMICRANRPLDLPQQSLHALLRGISRVIVQTDDVPRTVGWYEGLVGKTAGRDPQFEGLRRIEMDKGAHLLIDDGQLRSGSGRGPIAVIATPDLAGALAHVRVKGVKAGDVESRLGTVYFTFEDMDGNVFVVSER
ncbi:VOC family protein [Paenibacillus albus]|uniref:VOC family protein n=1 Tax=Paenibacillus albus TaxID=2495582 RepID=A0A3Q8X3V8_9BACL|nr:VOC family protein [Paenibacillus albus]AZN38640.1 VOC family protein [Paenibacillus albus]